jgi:SAM-dependent methyltransferase
MWHVLQKAIAGLNLEEFSFVDLGCGKGRALIMAAQLPFREVIGVELSPLHSKVADNNVKRFAASKHRFSRKVIRVVCANAIDFKFPDSDLLIYMYRPFLSAVVSTLADNLCSFHAETGYRVLLAYSCPLEEDVLSKHPGYIKLKEYQTISVEQSWSLWECRVEGPSPSAEN